MSPIDIEGWFQLYVYSKCLVVPIKSTDELPTSSLLLQINQLDGSSLQKMNQALNPVFEAQGYEGYIKDLNGKEITAQLYINRLDQVSPCLVPE